MLERVINLLGEEKVKKIENLNICVFGLGGVGGYVVEALVRSGVKTLTLIDNDVVKESNLNRQIIATRENLGKTKTEAWVERIQSIIPTCLVTTQTLFFTKDTPFDFTDFDYVIDCIDTISAKIGIIKRTYEQGIPCISSMGTGNKLDPSCLKITDISKTNTCPLARVVRTELRKIGIQHVDVLFSTEVPLKPLVQETSNGRHAPASMIFVPASAGLMIASYVIRKITGNIDE